MTRESRARWLALATALLVVALSMVFAALRNAPLAEAASPGAGTARPAARAPLDPARVAAGRAAFERLGCAGCHAIGGSGNPANPLDGVGARLSRSQLRDWALGQGEAAGQMSSRLAQRKARAASEPEVDVLLDYLQQLR